MNDTDKKTFWDFISNQEIDKIQIPIIQRDYAQGRDDDRTKQIRAGFLDAIFEVLNGNSNSLELDFVYGSLKDKVFSPLDGQQRLTTLFLLHWYIGLKLGKKLDAETIKSNLLKFTYETRESSRDFCKALVNNTNNLGIGDNISEQIKDSAWFFTSWAKDATIKGMLVMLDAIEVKAKNITANWSNLNNITFNLLYLNDFLSDDLYVKMNARGKPLTDFENFKARFEKHIIENKWENVGDNKEGKTNTFSHKIDTTWTDLFWKDRDENNNIDDYFLNFFKANILFEKVICSEENSIKNKDFGTEITSLIENKTTDVNYLVGLTNNCFLERITKIFDELSVRLCKEDNKVELIGFKEVEEFKNLIKGAGWSYAQLVKYFGYVKYLSIIENTNNDELKSWMRVVRNLVEGANLIHFNNAQEFANAIKFLNDTANHIYSNNNKPNTTILEYLKDSEVDKLKGFPELQFEEEITKAKLILSEEKNTWEKLIFKAENHGYFKGQIGFLLDFSKKEDRYCIDAFEKYQGLAFEFFGDSGLKDDYTKEHLFRRALLTITDDEEDKTKVEDYLLTKGSNYSFLKDNDRDISWKRLLRGGDERANQKRSFVRKLFDEILLTEPKISLDDIIKKFTDQTSWKYYFIQNREIIDYCKDSFVRIENKQHILLLTKKQTNGTHAEYYSYALWKQNLENEKVTYHASSSVSNLKYMKIENNIKIYELSYYNQMKMNSKNKIECDCKSPKDPIDCCYVIENNDNRFEVKTREETIVFINKIS